MKLKLRVIITTGLFMANGVFMASSPVLAQDGYANPDLGVSVTSPEASAIAVPDAKKAPLYEPKPGEKLTFKLITEILKTTRNLAGRNMSGLNLVGLDLSGCSLEGADMRGANLERADMSESNLERVDLTGANLKMASFFLSALTAAKLDQAVLDGAIWIDKSICSKGSIGKCLEISAKPDQPAQVHDPVNPADKTGGEKL
jgi:hypothetical protein